MPERQAEVQLDVEEKESFEVVPVEVWTERYIISGSVHIPTIIKGVEVRVSDFLSLPARQFVALTDVTLSSVDGQRLWQGDFLSINKNSIVLFKSRHD